MRTVVHPGPVGSTRIELAPCDGFETVITLEAGISLETAVANALKPHGFDSAWLELNNAAVDKLHYVIPALSNDAEHAAWYSDVHTFNKGHIEKFGMIVGIHQGQSFIHGHGLWRPANGQQAMGHILAPETILTAPVQATCIGLSGARFDRRRDDETNFTLFRVDPLKSQAAVSRLNPQAKEFAAIRLLPNQDFATAIDKACLSLGWTTACVFGLGSLIGACFEDGSVLDSLPTEFLITKCLAGNGNSSPEIVIVGIDGKQILSGRLAREKNPVLVTAELVLKKLE